ncbi:hypothetical protein PHET_11234 [Paragonimus heterotremus]|uniref:Uncharacterized protein n=1 Tax=Paragonimus heterotremus TaxID=100268 RepID=A0A8J4T939_9TREM|nr:hypothetical protein PHET_11234 [Paragonimus heterotremus]
MSPVSNFLGNGEFFAWVRLVESEVSDTDDLFVPNIRVWTWSSGFRINVNGNTTPALYDNDRQPTFTATALITRRGQQANSYVDDCHSFLGDSDVAMWLMKQVGGLLPKGGFQRGMWVLDGSELLNTIQPQSAPTNCVKFWPNPYRFDVTWLFSGTQKPIGLWCVSP